METDVPCGLGVELKQTGDGPAGGEVVLLNSSYTNTRFGFAYAWWRGRRRNSLIIRS